MVAVFSATGQPFARYFTIVSDIVVPPIDPVQLAAGIEQRRVQTRHELDTLTHGFPIGDLQVRFMPLGAGSEQHPAGMHS